MILGIDTSQANRKIRSGTEWYAFYLIQEFKKLLAGRSDIRIRLYTRDALQADLAANLPENFEVKILHWPLRYFWGQIRLSWEMLWHPPDILFCPAHTIPLIHPSPRRSTGEPSPAGGEGNIVGGRTYTTLHDVGFEDYPELYDKLSLWYHRFSAKLAVNKAHHIFTISEFSKSRIIENYDVSSDNITVTYLGYDQEKFRKLDPREVARSLQKFQYNSTSSIDLEQKSLLYNDRYIVEQLGYKDYLLFLGRLEPKKNILGMVKAYEQLQAQVEETPELVFAGAKVNLTEVEEYLQTHPDLADKIKFLGYIEEEDKPILYSGAALFLFSTLYEGFGLPILEAQACGTPVITSNTASNPEVAGEGAVIVDPESPYEIAEAIRELLINKNLRDEKVRKGLENVKKFSWHETANLTLKTMGIVD